MFNGWTLRVVAPAPVVPTLSTISNETVTAYGYYTTDCGGECGAARETLVYNTNGGYWDYDWDNPYDLSEMGQWGITFGTNVVKGESGCSFDSEDFPSWSGDNGEYCWCRVTSFTPDNGTEQEFTGSSWVFYAHMGDSFNCGGCASSCVTEVKNNSSFRSSVFDAAQ